MESKKMHCQTVTNIEKDEDEYKVTIENEHESWMVEWIEGALLNAWKHKDGLRFSEKAIEQFIALNIEEEKKYQIVTNIEKDGDEYKVTIEENSNSWVVEWIEGALSNAWKHENGLRFSEKAIEQFIALNIVEYRTVTKIGKDGDEYKFAIGGRSNPWVVVWIGGSLAYVWKPKDKQNNL